MTTSDSRERFEKYWKAQANFKESMLSKDGRYPDYYGNPVVQASWEGWQAALSHQAPAVAVSELGSLADGWDELSDAAYYDGEFDRRDVWRSAANRLRTLINKAGSDET